VKRAVSLLSTNAAHAGALAEQYQYWLAMAHMTNNNYQAAAESFGALARDFTNSVRLLEAGYGEAVAQFKLKEWAKVVALLQSPTGTFRRAAGLRPADELVVRGELLLAEAWQEQQQYADAEKVVVRLGESDLSPDLQWQRLHLLCRILLADQRVEAALAQTTNLLASASRSANVLLQADAYSLQGAIFEQLGRLSAALQVYENNLQDSVPADRRRESALKVIQLTLDLGRYEEAADRIKTFMAQVPDDSASEVALLTYGELHLMQALATLKTNAFDIPAAVPLTVTNDLALAQTRFQQFLTNYPQSALAGRAHLNQGWCLWMEGKVAESSESFARAASLIPLSYDKAVALFKLGDAHFFLKDYTNALSQYQQVNNEYAELSEVRRTLLDRALYQIIRTCLNLERPDAASAAMRELLNTQPASPWADRAMLVVGQQLSRIGQTRQGRAMLQACAERYADRPLLPEVELAIARTFYYDTNWTEAIANYTTWISRYPTNAQLPRAEFERAWAYASAKQETNALRQMTNFVARFPAHELAPRARFWIGDFYFNQRDFVSAQLNYQDTNLLASPLSYRARMMAGRAAFAGERWADASDNFKALLNDNQCPPTIVVEALFGLGDTFTRQSGQPDRPLEKYEQAIVVFSKIPQQHPDDPRVPSAWGRVGDCYFAMGNSDPKNYTTAITNYQQILNFPGASISARSQAEIRLAMAKEKLAQTLPAPEGETLRKAALDHYLNIVYGKSPVLQNGEKPDPFWLKEASLAAARMAEEQQDWTLAIHLYQRLINVLPPLRPALEKRIQKAREQLPRSQL
jgi:TolA-binding protein